MRVKQVPRHRIIQSDAASPENVSNLDDSSMTEETDATMNNSAEFYLNTLESYQTFVSCSNIHNHCAMPGPSSYECPEIPSEDDATTIWSSEDNNNSEVVDLSTKSCREHTEDRLPRASVESDDKFKDTFLYKIMTDPTFLESIQRSKQPKRFVCPFCKQEFQNDDELTSHMDVKKDDANQVNCCACKKTFAQKRYLRYHQRCHTERTMFTCDICTKKYTRMDNLTRHNAFHVNPNKFSCAFCEKSFARKDLLNKHQKCHDNKYRFYCEECVKYFKGQLTLDNHKKIFHSDA